MLDSLDHFKLHPVDKPVQASYMYTQDGGVVQFTNTSTRDEQWSWDFDNGSSSSEEHPQHTFAIGTYDVRMIAGNACTTDTVFHTITIETLGLDESSAAAFGLKQYGDHFRLTAANGPVDYAIYSLSGERVLAGRVSDLQIVLISKSVTSGLIVLTDSKGKRFERQFVSW